jgi:hypothetical protein
MKRLLQSEVENFAPKSFAILRTSFFVVLIYRTNKSLIADRKSSPKKIVIEVGNTLSKSEITVPVLC